jgi:hypothetical protein
MKPIPSEKINDGPIGSADPGKESVFGALSTQEVELFGQSQPAETAVGQNELGDTNEDLMEGNKIATLSGTTTTPESVLGSSTASATAPDTALLDDAGTVPAKEVSPSVPTTSVTTQISEEEEVVAHLNGEVMAVEETNLTAVKKSPVGGTPNGPEPEKDILDEPKDISEPTNMKVVPPENSKVTEPPFNNEPIVMTAEIEDEEDPEVLSESDQNTELSKLSSSNLGPIVGLGFSFIIFVFAIIYITKKRRSNTPSFDKDLTKEGNLNHNAPQENVTKVTPMQEDKITSLM